MSSGYARRPVTDPIQPIRRTGRAPASPTAATTEEKSIASSCSPTSALVDGVNARDGSPFRTVSARPPQRLLRIPRPEG